LNREPASTCYRSNHWYAEPPIAAAMQSKPA
jgi:hypothetical protein